MIRFYCLCTLWWLSRAFQAKLILCGSAIEIKTWKVSPCISLRSHFLCSELCLSCMWVALVTISAQLTSYFWHIFVENFLFKQTNHDWQNVNKIKSIQKEIDLLSIKSISLICYKLIQATVSKPLGRITYYIKRNLDNEKIMQLSNW